MASSKYPGDSAFPVPVMVVEAAKKNAAIVCNLRPEQRVEQVDRYTPCDEWIAIMLSSFLHALVVQERKKIALLFQGYNTIGTAIIDIKGTLWSEEGSVPRLDFDKSEEFKQIYGCPNFWSPFILGIAKVGEDTPVFCVEDVRGQKFIETVDIYGKVLVFCEPVKDPGGPCDKCEYLERASQAAEWPSGCKGNDTVFLCPNCGQHWWQYNTYLHLWRSATAEEVFALRQQEGALTMNGEPFPISDKVAFENGIEIFEPLPKTCEFKPGHIFMCDAGMEWAQIVTACSMSSNSEKEMFTIRQYP